MGIGCNTFVFAIAKYLLYPLHQFSTGPTLCPSIHPSKQTLLPSQFTGKKIVVDTPHPLMLNHLSSSLTVQLCPICPAHTTSLASVRSDDRSTFISRMRIIIVKSILQNNHPVWTKNGPLPIV